MFSVWNFLDGISTESWMEESSLLLPLSSGLENRREDNGMQGLGCKRKVGIGASRPDGIHAYNPEPFEPGH